MAKNKDEGTQIGDYIYTEIEGQTYKSYNPVKRKPKTEAGSEDTDRKRKHVLGKPKYEHELTFAERIRDVAAGGASYPVDVNEDRRAFESGPDRNLGALPDEKARKRIERHRARLARRREMERQAEEAGRYEIDLPGYNE